ncbi:MAG: hypothetical protein JSS49_28900 [Planctomycetes bacterium]|nr:hypothetical protein [Planctomycetota bacterium]
MFALFHRCPGLQVLGVMVIASSGLGLTEARDSKPTEEQQQTIQKGVDELTRPFGSTKKKEAIQKLVDASRNESFSSDERYVVLTTLISFTRDAGDGDHWLDAVNTLFDSYDLDRDQERPKLLVDFLKAAKPGSSLQPVIEAALVEIERAMSDDRFVDAGAMLAAVNDAVRRIPNDKLKAKVAASRQSFAVREKEWKEFEAASEKLRTDGSHAVSNFIVGRWHAVQKQDWQTALPFIEMGNDAKWKSAAALERTNPKAGMEQAAIGNAWYEIGDTATGAAKAALLFHAAEWYRRAEPNATSGLLKQQLADRLAEISKLNAPTATPISAPAADAAALPVGEWVDLLPKINFAEHVLVGTWKQLPQGGIVCDAFRYNSRIMAPIVAIGSFELQWKVTRKNGKEAVGLIWPVGNAACIFQLDAYEGTISGLEKVDGKYINKLVGTPATVAKPVPLTNGQLYEVHVKVLQLQDKASIEVTLDHRPVINWQGNTSQLSLHKDHCLPIINAIGINSFDAGMEVQELKIRLLRGVRGGAAGRGYWLGKDWKNPLSEVADRPSRDIAAKCLEWQGKKYLFIREPISLYQAQCMAQQVKGRLLAISSEQEEKMLIENGRDQIYWLADWHSPGGGWRDERSRFLKTRSRLGPGQPNSFPWEWKAAFNTEAMYRGWHDVTGNDEFCACIEWGEE